MADRLTIDALAAELHTTRRWLLEWLRAHPTDSSGRPFFCPVGRNKLFTRDDVNRIDNALREKLKCPSSSDRPVKGKARTIRSEVHISKSELTRAAELTGDRSLDPSSSGSKARSSEASTRRGKLHLVAGSARS